MTTILDLAQRLLRSLDSNYNVVDMDAVLEVIAVLETTKITREQLEITRLGKYINHMRRKTSNDALARRLKNLLKKWREMIMPSVGVSPQITPPQKKNIGTQNGISSLVSNLSKSSQSLNKSKMVVLNDNINSIPDFNQTQDIKNNHEQTSQPLNFKNLLPNVAVRKNQHTLTPHQRIPTKIQKEIDFMSSRSHSPIELSSFETASCTSVPPLWSELESKQSLDDVQQINSINESGSTQLSFSKKDSSRDVFEYHGSLSNSESTSHLSNSIVSAMDQNAKHISDLDLTFSGKFSRIKSHTSNHNIPFSNKKSNSLDTVVIESSNSSDGGKITMSNKTMLHISPPNKSKNFNFNASNSKEIGSLQLTPSENSRSFNKSPVANCVDRTVTPPVVPIIENIIVPVVAKQVKKVPQRRGRKKGSKGIDHEISNTSGFVSGSNNLETVSYLDIKHKIALINNANTTKKVKTTKELLAEIQNKTNLPASSSPSIPVIKITKDTLSSSNSHISRQLTPDEFRVQTPSTLLLINQQAAPAENSLDNCISSQTRQSNENLLILGNDLQTAKITLSSTEAIKQGSKMQFSTIDDEINFIEEQLPKIEKDCNQWKEDENVLPCTCTLEFVNDIVDDTNEISGKNSIAAIGECNEVLPNVESDKHISVITNLEDGESTCNTDLNCMSINQLVHTKVALVQDEIKKPIKSIFDLDYEDDEKNTGIFHNDVPSKNMDEKLHLVDNNTIRHNLTCESNNDNQKSLAINATSSDTKCLQSDGDNQLTNSQQQTNDDIPISPEFKSPWVVHEDPACKAKLFYETLKNKITGYHINLLHNAYLPNVNGNWNCVQTKKSNEIIYGGEHMINSNQEPINVVPRYDHMKQEHVVKDFKNINLFYMKHKDYFFRSDDSAADSCSISNYNNNNNNKKDNVHRKAKKEKRRKKFKKFKKHDSTDTGDDGDDDMKFNEIILQPNHILSHISSTVNNNILPITNNSDSSFTKTPNQTIASETQRSKKRQMSSSSTSSDCGTTNQFMLSGGSGGGCISQVDDIDEQLPNENNSHLITFNEIAEPNITGMIPIDSKATLNIEPGIEPTELVECFVFKEWHESVNLKSYNDEPLAILPYVIID